MTTNAIPLRSSLTFGTVLHAAVEVIGASNFKAALPHIPILAKAFGKDLQRITYGADRLALQQWQQTARRYMQPRLSASLEELGRRISVCCEKRMEAGAMTAETLFEVLKVEPLDIMMAGYFELLSSESYHRFLGVAQCALPSAYPLLERSAQTWAYEPWTVEDPESQINHLELGDHEEAALAELSDGALGDQWNAWLAVGMQMGNPITHEAAWRRTQSWEADRISTPHARSAEDAQLRDLSHSLRSDLWLQAHSDEFDPGDDS